MKQIIIRKHPLIEELSGSRIRFAAPEDLHLVGGKVCKVVIPFAVQVLSGGQIDLDFQVSQVLAENGVNMLGAYWDGKQVTACLMSLDGTEVSIDKGTSILTGILVQVVQFRQTDGSMLGAVLNMNQDGGAIAVQETPEERKPETQVKKARGKKK